MFSISISICSFQFSCSGIICLTFFSIKSHHFMITFNSKFKVYCWIIISFLIFFSIYIFLHEYSIRKTISFDPKWTHLIDYTTWKIKSVLTVNEHRLYNLENKELNNESLACVYEHSSLSRGWLLFFFKYNQTPYSRTLRIIFLY
jgi:hypothetical protein